MHKSFTYLQNDAIKHEYLHQMNRNGIVVDKNGANNGGFDGNRMDLLMLQFEMQSIRINAAGFFDINFGLLSAVCICSQRECVGMGEIYRF